MHQRPPCTPTGVISPDAEEMGEGMVRRLITNSTRLLMDHASAIFLCKLPGPRAIGKEPMLCILEILWALAWAGTLTIVRPSLHYLESIAFPRLLRLHIRAVIHSHIEKSSSSIATMTCGSIGTSFINIGHVVEYTEKWTSDSLTSTFFMAYNLSYFV